MDGDRGRFGPNPYVVNHGGHHPLEWLIFFLLLALVVALVVWLILRFTSFRVGAPPLAQAAGPRLDEALDVVRMRYARGEIDRREFLRLSKDLGEPAGPEPDAPTLAG